jgi:hypothetical protein
MCELHPPLFAVPECFVVGLEFMELSVGVKYLYENVLWEFVVFICHLRRPVFEEDSKVRASSSEYCRHDDVCKEMRRGA